MNPTTLISGKPDERLTSAAALWVTGIIDAEEADVFAGTPPGTVLRLLHDPAFQRATDAMSLRLRSDGSLTNFRAERLTGRMLERIEAAADELPISSALKVIELGLKFRERPEVSKAPSVSSRVVVLNPGDPDPEPSDAQFQLVIDLRGKNTDVIDAEVIKTEAE